MKRILAALLIMAAAPAICETISTSTGSDGDKVPTADTGKVDAGTPGAVQFSPDRPGRGNSAPGRIQAVQISDTAGNDLACLTVGTPDGRQVPVVDRYALHRVPYRDVDFPDYYVDFGGEEGVVIAGDGHEIHAFTNCTITGAGINPDTATYTKTFWIRPCNGGSLSSVKLDKVISVTPTPLGGGANLVDVDWSIIDDSVFVTVQLKQRMDTYYYEYAGCRITRVTKVDASISDVRDDLTSGDYYFSDKEGNTSLGGLRTWVKGRYDKYTADLWTDYPAKGQVRLGGNSVKYNGTFMTRIEDCDGIGDQFTIYSKAKPGIRIVAGAGSTSDTFKIVGIDVDSDPDYDLIYTDTSESNPYIISCHDLLTLEWEIPSGQSPPEVTLYKGEQAYVVAVPKDGSKSRFYRAVSEDGVVTASYVYTEFIVYAKKGVAIPDDNGNWWKIKVSTSGVLSTESVAGPSCEEE